MFPYKDNIENPFVVTNPQEPKMMPKVECLPPSAYLWQRPNHPQTARKNKGIRAGKI